MSFDWQEYKDFADALLNEAPDSQVNCRVAVSRAYYWTYNAATEWAAAQQFAVDTRHDSHAQLWDYFRDRVRGNPEVALAIADQGVALQQERVEADYKAYAFFTGEDVQDSLDQAKELVDNLRLL